MEEALNLFNEYYSTFDSSLSGVNRKYDHTLRVVEYAKRIAKSLNLNDKDYELACKCALFHDISRFKQWQEYKTFEDSVSFDHGDKGCEILKELGINDEIILISTKLHNKYKLPDDLDERTKMFVNITRDADKLDIMISLDRVFEDNELILPDEVLDSFENHEMVKNNAEAWSSQGYHVLRALAFMFDIKYKESLKILKDLDLTNYKCNLILNKFDDERIKQIKDICNKYIDERISD